MKNVLLQKFISVLLFAVYAVPVSAQNFIKPGIYLEEGPDIVTDAKQVDVSITHERCCVQIKPKTNLEGQRSNNNQSLAYSAQAQHELSAIGIRWRLDNHRIYYIDRNSDAYGKVFFDDILLSSDGMSPDAFHETGAYLNNENTPVTVVVWHNSQINTITAYRHPVSSFGPIWHRPWGCY